jgi:hypothetical protein
MCLAGDQRDQALARALNRTECILGLIVVGLQKSFAHANAPVDELTPGFGLVVVLLR